MPISPLDELRVDDWDEMIDVNIKGVLYGIAAALPVFRPVPSDTLAEEAAPSSLVLESPVRNGVPYPCRRARVVS